MRSVLFQSTTVVTLAILLALSSAASAQDGNETTGANSLPLFMDAAPVEGDAFEEPTYTLLFSESGTATALATRCTPQAGHGKEAVARWVSNESFEYPVTFTGAVNVSVTITGGDDPVPQPWSQGAVEIELMISAGETAAHPVAVGQTQVAPRAGPQDVEGLPGGTLPTSAQIEVDTGDPHTIPANNPFVATISVTCGQGDWNLEVGQIPALSYMIGAPGDTDSDGDGIPDPYDPDDDNDEVTDTVEEQVGSDPRDQTVTPSSDSANCPGYTYEEVFEATGDPTSCPVEDSFPWLLIFLVVLVAILLLGGGAGAFVVVNKKIKMTVSHDGFQAIDKGQAAQYELTLIATGKKEEEIPVELTLKGVPEDWSASLEPSHLTLLGGEAAEAQTAILRLSPPPEEAYESEAQVVVTATPTDEEGKTSAMKPGTSVKTKTIVNIGVTPPEGEGKKKKPKKEKKAEPEVEEGSADAPAEGGKKKLGMGLLKRKKKGDEEETPAEEAAEEQAAASAAAEPATGAAAAAPASPAAGGKPSVAMGKMVHDPADFSAGDEVTTTVTVRNKGDGPVEGLTLSLYVNDQRADQHAVALGPGESEEVTFKWTAQPDENRVKLKGSMKGA